MERDLVISCDVHLFFSDLAEIITVYISCCLGTSVQKPSLAPRSNVDKNEPVSGNWYSTLIKTVWDMKTLVQLLTPDILKPLTYPSARWSDSGIPC